MDRKKKIIAAAAMVTAGVGGFAVASNAVGDSATPSSTSTSGPRAGSGGDVSQKGERAGGQRGGDRGGHEHTAVTGDELAKVTAAVNAEDSSVTVSGVMKDGDGSYDVRATRDGERVMYEVSSDLKTITERTGGPGGKGGGQPPADGEQPSAQEGGDETTNS